MTNSEVTRLEILESIVQQQQQQLKDLELRIEYLAETIDLVGGHYVGIGTGGVWARLGRRKIPGSKKTQSVLFVVCGNTEKEKGIGCTIRYQAEYKVEKLEVERDIAWLLREGHATAEENHPEWMQSVHIVYQNEKPSDPIWEMSKTQQ